MASGCNGLYCTVAESVSMRLRHPIPPQSQTIGQFTTLASGSAA